MISPNATLVTAEIQADPKGYLPKFIVNFIQKDWPAKTLKAMEREAAADDLVHNAHVKKELDI